MLGITDEEKQTWSVQARRGGEEEVTVIKLLHRCIKNVTCNEGEGQGVTKSLATGDYTLVRNLGEKGPEGVTLIALSKGKSEMKLIGVKRSPSRRQKRWGSSGGRAALCIKAAK